MLHGEAVFIPDLTPRHGVIAFWGTGSGSGKVELVFAGGRYGIRKRLVSADLVPVADALPMLLSINPEAAGRPDAPVRRSVSVWSAAAIAGVA